MNTDKFRRILMAVDGSPQSENAVEVVSDFGSQGAAVQVVHVWNLEVTNNRGRWDVETRSKAQQLVQGYAAKLNAAGLKATGLLRTASGSRTAGVILEAAEEFGADLIAIGSRGRSDLGGLFLGSVSHHVVAGSDRPVLIVRAAPHGAKANHRILLALAGGDEVPSAVSTTIAMARQWGADVVVVHVSRIMTVEAAVWVEPTAEADGLVNAAVNELSAAGVRARGQVVTSAGSIATEIAEIAEGWDADLIVMGSRRLGELVGLLTSATDHALLHRTDTPVLITERNLGHPEVQIEDQLSAREAVTTASAGSFKLVAKAISGRAGSSRREAARPPSVRALYGSGGTAGTASDGTDSHVGVGLMKRLGLRTGNRKIDELATVPLFDHVPQRVLRVIAANVDEVEVAAGETLIQEDRRNDAFWIVIEGEAEMTIAGSRRRGIGPGQFFGATSMLDGKPAVATVVSRTPIRAYVASAEQFRALEGDETIALRLFHYALERMREDLEAHGTRPVSAAPGSESPRSR